MLITLNPIDIDDLLNYILSFLKNDYKHWFSIYLISKRWNILANAIFDLSINDNQPIQLAYKKGCLHSLLYLLQNPRIDPTTDDNYALRSAFKNGHLEIVKLLLQHPKVDPSVRNNYIINIIYKTE